eukprot:gene31993-38684_t
MSLKKVAEASGDLSGRKSGPVGDERESSFLSCKDLLAASIASKSMLAIVMNIFIINTDAERSCIKWHSAGVLLIILDLAKTIVYSLGLANLPPKVAAIVEKDGAEVIRTKYKWMTLHMLLHSCIFTYWHGPDHLTDVYRSLQAKLRDNCTKGDIWYEVLDCFQHDCPYWWTSRVYDSFILLFDRPDGTVLVSEDSDKVYLALGHARTIGEIGNFEFRNGELNLRSAVPCLRYMHSVPVLGAVVETTLLNWKGQIVYDGTVTPKYMAKASSLKKALRAYAAAQDAGTVIHRLPLVHDPFLLPMASQDQLILATHSPQQLRRLCTETAQDVQALMAQPAGKGSWLVRSDGYAQALNPLHYSTIRVAYAPEDERPLDVFRGDQLQYSAQECLVALRRAAALAKQRPAHIYVDCEPAMRSVRYVLQQQVGGPQVHFLPPLSPEALNVTSGILRLPYDPMCAVCSRTLCEDGTRLLTCSVCRTARYCSKKHQKAHWAEHKKTCKAAAVT